MVGIMTEREPRSEDNEIQLAADRLGETFILRWDRYARQSADRYVAIQKPLRGAHLLAHLRGELTLGTYLLNAQSQGRFLVLDADDEPDRRRLQALAWALADMECPSYLEKSRRGAHLWFFLDALRPGADIRRFGQGLRAHFQMPAMELFPKQDRLRSGPGSLIRLPFGVHQRSGRRYGFVTPDGVPLAPTLRQQIQLLSRAATVPIPVWERFLGIGTDAVAKSRKSPRSAPFRPDFVGDHTLSAAEIKGTITARQFILRFVELTPAGMGLCPFHDDHNPSFSVSDEENFWYCFACAEGGDIIDFWMKWRSCDFKTAIGDLSQMLMTEWIHEEDDERGVES